MPTLTTSHDPQSHPLVLPLTQSRLAPAFNLTYHVLLAGSIAVLPLLVRNYQYFLAMVLFFCHCVTFLLRQAVITPHRSCSRGSGASDICCGKLCQCTSTTHNVIESKFARVIPRGRICPAIRHAICRDVW